MTAGSDACPAWPAKPGPGRRPSGGPRGCPPLGAPQDAAVGVEDRVVPAVEVGDALPGLVAGQHVGAQRDHRAPAEARVPRAVVRRRVGEVDRSGADREARVPQGAVPALQRVGQQRLEALGGGLGRLGGIELEEHEAPRRFEGADVQARGGQALAVAVALPRQRRGGRPSRRGARPGRRRRRGPPGSSRPLRRTTAMCGHDPPSTRGSTASAKLTRAEPRAGCACRPPCRGRRPAGRRRTPPAHA